MPLYEITPERIVPLLETTFAAAGLRERADLQRLLRERVEIISPDTLVVAEEFGEWEDSRRRIDLLGLDRGANLVVIELKRTEDGGHMELQALRYAAMVSTMTFDHVVETFGAYLQRLGRADDPRAMILEFLGWEEPDDERFAQDVRIVLASAEFSRELTTTVLWLSARANLDIRCVRLRSYQHGGRLVLDVQQVIPLPEAADYQVRLREKVQREREARREASTRDYTKYTVVTPHGLREGLPKRRAILEVVKGLSAAGVPVPEIQQVLQTEHGYGPSVLRSAPGDLDSDAFVAAVTEESRAEGRAFDPSRFFCADEDLIRSDRRTYALTNQWGVGTFAAIESLLRAFPDRGISCTAVEAGP
ncbi:MAG: hypothetical protein HYU88_01180 [Chloroflexi bacterium]|nr:hypothetical protein [Chloroflexota bacterium]